MKFAFVICIGSLKRVISKITCCPVDAQTERSKRILSTVVIGKSERDLSLLAGCMNGDGVAQFEVMLVVNKPFFIYY